MAPFLQVGTPTRPIEAESHMYLSHIGAALQDYAQAHDGQLPSSVDELVPDHIAPSNMVWFFPPYDPALAALRAAAPIVQHSNLVSNSMFVYLGEAGRGVDCVLFERPDLLRVWRGSQGNRILKVNVVGAELTAKRVDMQDLIKRLSSIGRMRSVPRSEETQ